MKKISLALAAMLAMAGAQAATVTTSFGTPTLAQQTTEIAQSGSLNLFSAAQGTLTGATIDLYGASTMSFTGKNTAAQQQQATLNSSVDLFFGSSLAGLNSILAPADINMAATSGRQTYAVGQTLSFGPFNMTGTQSFDLSSILSSLTGLGAFTVNCTSLSGLGLVGGGGNIATTQTTTAGCGAKVTYTYTVAPPPVTVPEPSSLALVGLALAGAGLVARRRQA